MKFYKSRTAKWLTGRGFYVVLACCMIAIGFAAYSAMDAVRLDDKQSESSSMQNSQISEYLPDIPSYNVTEQSTTIKPQSSSASKPEQQEEGTAVDGEVNTASFIMPLVGTVSKDHSEDTLQYSKTYNDMRLHLGVDIMPTDETTVLSAAPGKVAAIDNNTVLGNVVTVDHGDGILFRYCGLKDISVDVGQKLTAGDTLGKLDVVTNECADEIHLHLEATRDGKSVSPLEIIANQ